MIVWQGKTSFIFSFLSEYSPEHDDKLLSHFNIFLFIVPGHELKLLTRTYRGKLRLRGLLLPRDSATVARWSP